MKNCKKLNLSKLYNINKNDKKITEKLPISGRIEKKKKNARNRSEYNYKRSQRRFSQQNFLPLEKSIKI